MGRIECHISWRPFFWDNRIESLTPPSGSPEIGAEQITRLMRTLGDLDTGFKHRVGSSSINRGGSKTGNEAR